MTDWELPEQDERALVTMLAHVKSRQDVAAALEIYHPDGIMESPSMNSRAVGTASIQRHLESWFRMAPDYSVELGGAAVDGKTLASWGWISLTLHGAYEGQVPNGVRARVPVFILFGFKDKRIVWESFNFDLAALCRQSGVSAEAVYPMPKERRSGG